MKSHLLKQNNNNETSPHASPRSSPKLNIDATTTAVDMVKNGKVEEPKPGQQQPPAQPSPGLTQVLTPTASINSSTHSLFLWLTAYPICPGKRELQRLIHSFYHTHRTKGQQK